MIFDKNTYTFFHDAILALSYMEQQGFRIDLEYIRSKKIEITNTIEQLEKEFKSTKFFRHWQHTSKTPININSGIQLSNYLYKVKKIKINKETTSGQGSTDEEALQELDIPELNILLRIKKLKLLRKTYLDGYEREQVNGIIHPIFNLHLVRTYRGSADSPNVQNVPKRDEEAKLITRKAIYPRPGHQLMEIDFKQLEVRIAACYNKDPKLIKDILEGDMHRDVASEIFFIEKYNAKDPTHKTLRNATKNGFIFPEFYGDYYKNCAINLSYNWGQLPKNKRWEKGHGIPFEDIKLGEHLINNGIKSLNDFEKHLEEIEHSFWYERYKVYSKWKDNWWKQYQEKGYFKSKTGFIYQGLMNKKDALNYPIQGSAFHCLLWCIIEGVKAQRTERWDTKIISQIHDAIILDVNPKELDHVVNVMKCIMCHDLQATWKWITVPLDVDIEICDIDKSWAEKKPYEKN